MFVLLYSTSMYMFLHYKTHMQLRLIFIDNIIVSICVLTVAMLLPLNYYVRILITIALVPLFVFINIHIRFWRSPKRKISEKLEHVVSPADGRIIYIKEILADGKLESDKRGSVSELFEISKTELSPAPCWQIGINMTPFDVHKNCSPINGVVLFSKHFAGLFLSLKDKEAVSQNERHTYVIGTPEFRVAVVQIASKRVRRIDAYVEEKSAVKKGDWIGMIRFGSQVDVFIPIECELLIEQGQQLYAGSTVIARIPDRFIERDVE